MKTWVHLLFAFAMAVTPVCAQKVKVVFDKSTDFSKYNTYAWRPGRTLKQGKKLENERLMGRVEEAMKALLADSEAVEDTANPDAYITYFVGTEEKSWVDNFSSFDHSRAYNYGYSVSMNNALAAPQIRYDRKGILVIDVVDAKDDKLVWRAYCTANITNPEKTPSIIYKAVKKAFGKYPAKD
jgi:hypothetical protein